MTGKLYELDVFVTEQEDRNKAISVWTGNTEKLSDHKPKCLNMNLLVEEKKKHVEEKGPKKINWDRLRNEATAEKFREEVRDSLKEAPSWTEYATALETKGREVCGVVKKTNLKPWLDENALEIKAHQRAITELTSAIAGGDATARERRKELRKTYRAQKVQWEESWWLRIVEKVKEAGLTGDARQLYQTLRQIGVKKLNNVEEEQFSPDEYRDHFKRVSENRYERSIEEVRATAAEVETRTGPLIDEGKEFLKKEISLEEMRREVMKIRDSAPGVDGIRALAIKSLDEDGGTKLFECVKKNRMIGRVR